MIENDENAEKLFESLLITYIVLNSSLYSSSPLFSLINESNLSISSLSISRNDPRADYENNRKIYIYQFKYTYVSKLFYCFHTCSH